MCGFARFGIPIINYKRETMSESWIRLTITYPEPTDENFESCIFEQDVYGTLYAYGTATINEQDSTTMDGKDIEVGKKRLLCYFEADQSVYAAEVRTAVEQLARRSNIEITTACETFEDESWKDGWKAWFKPAQISSRIAVRTPWCEFTPAPGSQCIVIEPGMAFGTGLHETTQLCIQAIDENSADGSVQSLLDVGCGSGILSIAACLCQIPNVRGVDNDPICIDVSKENGAANHVDAQFDDTDIWDVEEKYDLVVANIISPVLRALKEDIKNACRIGGKVVLSGILAEEREEVEHAFTDEGVKIRTIDHRIKGEWCSITFIREA